MIGSWPIRPMRLVETTTDPTAAVVKGFLDPERCQQLARLAQDLYEAEEMYKNVFQGHTWVANVDERATPRLRQDPRFGALDGLRRDVLGDLRISNPTADSLLGDFISYMIDGGFVVKHRDDWQMESPDFECRVRCNVFVQKEPGSGDPCLGPDAEGSPQLRLGLSTGDLLFFSPTETVHSATRVLETPRIMVSFGFLMKKASFRGVLEGLGPGLR